MKRHIWRRPTTDDRRPTSVELMVSRPQCFRRSSLIVRLAVLVVLLLPVGAAAQTAEQALVVPAGQVYAGNLATLTRDIRVEGVVTGDVTSWSGSIVIAGEVRGDVVGYSGQVRLLPSARIDGHVLASGGALRLDAGAAVAGQTIRGEGGGVALANLLDLFAPSEAGGAAVVGRALFGAVLGVFLLAFTLLCIAFWPRRTFAASMMLRRSPGRALALGLLTTLLLALALPPLLALLAATLIGLPLIVVLLALAQALYIYGLATLAQAAGALAPRSTAPDSGRDEASQPRLGLAWARGGAGPTGATLVAAIVPALLVALVAALTPLWGLALLYLLASPGLGAAILSRGGLLAPAYQ